MVTEIHIQLKTTTTMHCEHESRSAIMMVGHDSPTYGGIVCVAGPIMNAHKQ